MKTSYTSRQTNWMKYGYPAVSVTIMSTDSEVIVTGQPVLATGFSIASRLFTLPEQGAISVAAMLATFAGQLTFAVVVESRLSSAGTARRVTFPRWLAALALLAAVAVAIGYHSAVVVCIALPVLVAALEVGRGVSVAERLDGREFWAALSVGAGALVGVLAGFAGAPWAMIPLVAGIVGATIVRSMPVSHVASAPEPRVMAWVVADVGITGGVYPLLNTAILGLLGPLPVNWFVVAPLKGLPMAAGFVPMRMYPGVLILGSGMDVGGWAPGNMVSGIRPPSAMWPRCACAALAIAIRARARTVRFSVVMMRLMAVMARWVIGMWVEQRRRQASPFGRIPGSHDIEDSTTSRDSMSGFSTPLSGSLKSDVGSQ